MWSEAFDRLWEAHFLENVGLPGIGDLEPVVWFGILNAGGVAARDRGRGAARQAVGARGPSDGPHASSSGSTRSSSSSALVFALAGSLWLAVSAYWVTRVARNVAGPVFITWVQRSIGETDARATVLSITNQADAVGQWTGGPFLGGLGNVFGIRAALAAGAFCMAPALWLYGRAARHDGRIEELEADPAVV